MLGQTLGSILVRWLSLGVQVFDFSSINFVFCFLVIKEEVASGDHLDQNFVGGASKFLRLCLLVQFAFLAELFNKIVALAFDWLH